MFSTHSGTSLFRISTPRSTSAPVLWKSGVSNQFDGTTSTKTTKFFGAGPLNQQGEVNPQVQIWSFAR